MASPPRRIAVVGPRGGCRCRLAGACARGTAARGLRYGCAHRAPAAEPARGAARCGDGHAGAAAAPGAGRCGRHGGGVDPASPAVRLPPDPGRAAAPGCGCLARCAEGRAGCSRGGLAPLRARRDGPGRPGRRPLPPGARRHTGQLCAADRPGGHRAAGRMAHEPGDQPGARGAGPGWPVLRRAARAPAGPHGLALQRAQAAGIAEPAPGRGGRAHRDPGRAALVGHAGLVRAHGSPVGRRAGLVAPARGTPAGRRAAAPGPGGPAQHPGRAGRRHGARAQPTPHGLAGQHPGRQAPAGRIASRPGHRLRRHGPCRGAGASRIGRGGSAAPPGGAPRPGRAGPSAGPARRRAGRSAPGGARTAAARRGTGPGGGTRPACSAGRTRGPAADRAQPGDECPAGHGAGAGRRAPAGAAPGPAGHGPGGTDRARPWPGHTGRGARPPVRAFLHHARGRPGPGTHAV